MLLHLIEHSLCLNMLIVTISANDAPTLIFLIGSVSHFNIVFISYDESNSDFVII